MKNQPTEQQLQYGGKDAGVLRRFMLEFFPFAELRKAGFFTKEMRGDYYAQAERVCRFFGFKTVFEYRSQEMRCHLSFNGKRPQGYESFVTVTPSIWDE